VNGSSYSYVNPNTPADGSCKVFGSNGGNLSSPPLVPAYLVVDPAGVCGGCMHPQNWMVSDFQIQGVGTSAPDLALWIGRLTKQQCIAVNNKFGVNNPGGNPPADTITGCNPSFQGTYGTCSDVIGDDSADLVGKADFCFDWGGGAMGYLYLHVLLER
jgi:hypothetical protein